MTTTTRTTVSDRVRRRVYFLRLSWFVQDLPKRDRRAIYADLRASLDDAAAREGMAAALRDLGPTSALGAGYREAQDRRLPHWMSGVSAFAVALYAYMLAMTSYMSGALAVAEQTAPGERTTFRGRWIRTSVEVESGPDTLSFTQEVDLTVLVVLFLVFFVFARGWRLWTGRRTPSS